MKNYNRCIVVLLSFVLIPILATAGESNEKNYGANEVSPPYQLMKEKEHSIL